MSSFMLKIIGILTMFSDHIGYILYGHFSFFNLIGRISFPLFAFQMTQGYIHTKNLKKRMLKLLCFGLLAQIPFMLFLSTFQTGSQIFTLNIFFTLLLGLIAILVYDKNKQKVLGVFLALLICGFGELLHVDYGFYGVLLVFLFYFFRNVKLGSFIAVLIFCILRYIPLMLFYPNSIKAYSLCFLFTLISSWLIAFYNGKEGPKAKYLFYVFYPAHLLLLYGLYLLLH